jgi:hypothetical protein
MECLASSAPTNNEPSRLMKKVLTGKTRAPIYQLFCEDADRATVVLQSSRGVALSATYDELRYRELKDKKDMRRPGSLLMIFAFYAKIQSWAGQLMRRLATFDQYRHLDATISFFELLVFCRDFKIVPTLISKRDIFNIWKWTFSARRILEKQRQGETPGELDNGLHTLC